jgi:Na+-transporting NADH:ubiquinone oxidoreductase subunit F
MAIIEYKGKISKIINQCEDVKLFEISLDKNIEFKTGQFVNLIIEDEGEKYQKPYSIASIPSMKNKIELSIKLVKGGRATPHIFKKKEGDEVLLKGPFGLFNCEKQEKEKLVFIGTGTGIAPLRSMILNLIENSSDKEILLIFGNKYKDELLFEEEFEELEKLCPNFRYIKVLSREEDSWEGRKGHVQDNFDMIDPINSSFYICGLPQMVKESEEKLMGMGVQKEQIHKEKFV